MPVEPTALPSQPRPPCHQLTLSALATLSAYLARQSFPAEILVVDDGSTDGTAGLAASYAGVHILRCDHRGKGFAVRAGALAARGEYVLLCDADLVTSIEEWKTTAVFQRQIRCGDRVAEKGSARSSAMSHSTAI